MNKLLAAAIMILFISVSVIPSTGTTEVKQITMPISNGNTLYVGGSGPNNYTKIQDAIDNASDGDTVFVFNGTYHENPIINKSIILTGENKVNTFIDLETEEIGILINADFVTLSDFHINNSRLSGVSINDSHHCNIFGNIITSVYFGIHLRKSSNNTISDNVIFDIRHPGIGFFESHENIITNNLIERVHHVCAISVYFSDYNTFINNTLSRLGNDGFQICDSQNNALFYNKILNNNGSGIRASRNINNSIICCNRVEYNKKDGIVCDNTYPYTSNHSIISGNRISFNGRIGLEVSDCFNFTISENYLLFNNRSGISLHGNNNQISKNIVMNNNNHGIYISGSINCSVKNNIIARNKRYGLFLRWCFDTNISSNTFERNRIEAFYEETINTKWNGNFWNRPRFFPKVIIGKFQWFNLVGDIYIYRFELNFDRNPASEPYDIGV